MPGALKGEDIFCQITSVKRNFGSFKLLSVNKASKFRDIPCVISYETCGGCQIMHLKYDKHSWSLGDRFIATGPGRSLTEGFEQYDIRLTIGMQEPYYRAKLQFQTRKLRARWSVIQCIKIAIICGIKRLFGTRSRLFKLSPSSRFIDLLSDSNYMNEKNLGVEPWWFDGLEVRSGSDHCNTSRQD